MVTKEPADSSGFEDNGRLEPMPWRTFTTCRAQGLYARGCGCAACASRVDKRRRKGSGRCAGKSASRISVDRYADTFRRLGFNMTVDESSLPHAWPAPPFEPSAYASE